MNILSSSKPGSNEQNIVDSTKLGFVSSYQKKEKQPTTETTNRSNQQRNNINEGRKFVENTLKDEMNKKTTQKEEKDAMNLVKNLVQHSSISLNNNHFKFTNMLFIKYDAKNKEMKYDKTPLILSLDVSRGYVLGLNLHWCPVPLRVTFLKVLMKANQNAIKKGTSLKITYKIVKPLIMSLGLGPVIRLYIRNRISRRGVIIPPGLWLVAARLNSANFTGKPPEELYKKALTQFKNRKYK